MHKPDRIQLKGGLNISRLVTGLWQVADQEREGKLDLKHAAEAVCEYAEAGFDTFDMADHYGSAELIAGEAKRQCGKDNIRILTKWCPEPGPMNRETVRRGIGDRLHRLGVDCIDLLQLHWWDFTHPGYIDAMDELSRARSEGLIGNLGLTNVDSDHLHLLVREGHRIATNQVCISLLDHRALGGMSAVCENNDVKLLAYGVLAGGFLSERWLDEDEPRERGVTDWSKMKYHRFIENVGGWSVFQGLLRTVARIAVRHDVSVANVATRWVLDQSAVAAVIIGARLNERVYREDNLRASTLTLDDKDHDEISQALDYLKPIAGDCGDEYRHPPILTASGDLSHHITEQTGYFSTRAMKAHPDRMQIDSDSEWEAIAGYSRALRVGQRILVSGTTATHGSDRVICRDDPRGQTAFILDRITSAIKSLGGSVDDIVLTRIYLANAEHWEEVARVHGAYFGARRPANTLIEVSRLIGDYVVEIEAEAILDKSL